jgi:hypothetical protein
MRPTNKSGVCGRCRQRELNAERCRARHKAKKQPRLTPTELEILTAPELASSTWGAVVALGHDIGPMEKDVVAGAYLAQCRDCMGFACVDVMEDPKTYGKATEGPCPGVVPHQPSERRSVYTDPTSYTSLSAENADRGEGIYELRDGVWGAEEKKRWA